MNYFILLSIYLQKYNKKEQRRGSTSLQDKAHTFSKNNLIAL